MSKHDKRNNQGGLCYSYIHTYTQIIIDELLLLYSQPENIVYRSPRSLEALYLQYVGGGSRPNLP